MAWDWTLVSAPAQEPVSLTEAKLQCKVDMVIDDVLIEGYIRASRQAFEEYASRGPFTQTWKLVGPGFNDEIRLPRAAPLQSVEWVKYYDNSNVLQTLSASVYTAELVAEPGYLFRTPYQVWPAVGPRPDAVQVQYIVGWASVATIPAPIKQGMLLLIAHWYRNRETVVIGNVVTQLPFSVESLWAPWRVWMRPMDCAS